MIYEQPIHVFISSAPIPPGQGMTGQRQPILHSFNIEHIFVVDIWNTRGWRGRDYPGFLPPAPTQNYTHGLLIVLEKHASSLGMTQGQACPPISF